MEEDAGPTVEQPAHETKSGVTELELQFRQDEFVEIDRGDDAVKEKLKDQKVAANNSYAVEMFFCLSLARLACLCTGIIRSHFNISTNLLIKLTITYFVCEHEFFVCVPQYLLLNEVCCSLINKSTAPGQTDWDAEKSVWTRIMQLAKEISVSDPEFLLKVGNHVCKSWFVSFFNMFIKYSTVYQER